jgi:hypothetical protein
MMLISVILTLLGALRLRRRAATAGQTALKEAAR